jgi:glutamate N-acetyltransferase/amino-acid N-acetyltransferase
MAAIKSFTIKQIDGGVTTAQGFCAGSYTAGIKSSKKPDSAMIVSALSCSAAGAYTTNAVRASSVDWCNQVLPSNGIKAIFANSGNANACTGKRGMDDTQKIATKISRLFGDKKESVLVAATGVIGHFLPMNKIEPAISPLYAKSIKPNKNGGSDFAKAIMTTDTKMKECAVKITCGKEVFTIGGCTKGSGMIHPNMATMLAFITTDAAIVPTKLNTLVKYIVDKTFNNLTVDGDTSTNDMVLVLANGASDVEIKSPTLLAAFEKGLYTVCDTLCRKIAEDGEGATKRVEICIAGGKTFIDAKKAAKAIANSNLVKTALFGNDPNWGRIVCAIGYSGAHFSKEKIQVSLCGTKVFKAMRPLVFDAARLSGLMNKSVVNIDVDLGEGKECAVAHTCDLTYDYIKINAEYHT